MCYNNYVQHVLSGIIRSRRVASAYLFTGPVSSAKAEEAEAFAAALGCQPIDRLTIAPTGATIKIEQVWELQQLCRFGPAVSDYQVITVKEADKLTPEAAAAFLKTLEEPPARVVFILLIDREERLPATIASRCQKIIFEEVWQPWQPKPEWQQYYAGLKGIAQKSLNELLAFSALLEKEKEHLEELLYDLAYYARYELNKVRLVRELLQAIKRLKQKANVKICLDVACLKMGAA